MSSTTNSILTSMRDKLKSMSECIEEIADNNTIESVDGLSFVSAHLAVDLKELQRIKDQLEVQTNVSIYSLTNQIFDVTFKDLDSDCFVAIFKHLTLRQKLAVERVNKSWQNAVKRALKSQSELIVIKTTNRLPFDRNPDIEFEYEKKAAVNVFAMLSKIRSLNLVGFELNFQKFGIVKKFTRLTNLTLTNCTFTDVFTKSYKLSTLSVLKSIESFEIAASDISPFFVADFLKSATSLKRVRIHPISLHFEQWPLFSASISDRIENFSIWAVDFQDYLKSLNSKTEFGSNKQLILGEKLANLKHLEIFILDFLSLQKLTRMMPNLAQLKSLSVLNLDGDTTINGSDLKPFKNLKVLNLGASKKPCLGVSRPDSLNLRRLAEMPVFANLKRLALLDFKISVYNLTKLCENIPNVERVEWIYQIDCSCKKMSGERDCQKCFDFLDCLRKLKKLKSLAVKGVPDCRLPLEELFKKNALVKLRFLRVDSEIVNKEFLEAVFAFAKKSHKKQFLLHTTKRISISSNLKPANVVLMP